MHPVNSVQSTSALDRVNPPRLWQWAILIALAGVVLRALWFAEYEADLPFAFGSTLSGHAWALDPQLRAVVDPGALDSYELTRAFAPGYGALLRGVVEAAGGPSAGAHAVGLALLIVQSGMLFLATLLTFALSRRVLFGYVALLPAALLSLSVALLDLPGGLAPQLPTMLLLLGAIWLLTLVRERLPEDGTSDLVAMTIGGGFLLGAAVLFNPAILLAVLPLLWWAFRGIGRAHATLLLVATMLLPACWLAVAQSQLPDGIPASQATEWTQSAHEKIPTTASEIVDRGYAVLTPWNERWASGGYASRNWNWEWILPDSLRADSTYRDVSDGLAIIFVLLYAALIVLGLIELMAEGAGAAARLIGWPVLALPLATFLAPGGNLLRLPILPLALIALVLGIVWAIDRFSAGYSQDSGRGVRTSWT